jgi:hypothetical protein
MLKLVCSWSGVMTGLSGVALHKGLLLHKQAYQ